jgi:hypothetical protein
MGPLSNDERLLSALATRADANAAACRARAAALRTELATHYADFTRCSVPPVVEGTGVGDAPESGLLPESATDAFDIQLAQCEEEDQALALELAEEHMKTGENGKALAGYLSFLQSALVSGIQGGHGGASTGAAATHPSHASHASPQHPSVTATLLPPGSPLRPGSAAGSDGGGCL